MNSYNIKSALRAWIFLFVPSISFAFQIPTGDEGNILDSLLNVPINTASRHWQTVNDAPASVSIITSEDIKRFGYETLKEALQSVRGFYISDDRNYSYVGVRGFSRPTDYNDRIVLLVNGHKVNESVFGSCYIGWELGLNMEAVERIEIVHGPGSSLYGTGAMFAVINIITGDGAKAEGLRSGIEAGSLGKVLGKASFGHSFNNEFDISISGTIGRTEGKDLYYPEYDAPETHYGVAHDLDWERYAGVLTKVNYGNWSFQNMVSLRSKGIPTGSYGIAFNDPSSKTADVAINTGLVYEGDLDENKSLTVRGSYLHDLYEGYYPYAELTRDKSIGDQLTLGGQLLWDVSSKNRLIVGLEGVYNPTASYYYSSPEVVYFDNSITSSILSVYIHDEYQLFPFLTVIGGLRSDMYSYSGAFLAPRVATVVTPSLTTTMKFLYGEAFRAPNYLEMYYEDPTTGVKKSAGLEPERILTTEAILEQRLGDQYFAVLSVYRYNMKDLIDYQLDEADSLLQYRNTSSVLANGIEIGLQARYKSGIALQANYSYQQAADKISDEDLTNSPRHVAKAGIGIPVTGGVTVSTECRYETERITVYGSETGAYLIGDVTLNAEFPVEGLGCMLKIRNVFDRQYSLPGGLEHLQPGIEQDGRTIGFSLTYSFR